MRRAIIRTGDRLAACRPSDGVLSSCVAAQRRSEYERSAATTTTCADERDERKKRRTAIRPRAFRIERFERARRSSVCCLPLASRQCRFRRRAFASSVVGASGHKYLFARDSLVSRSMRLLLLRCCVCTDEHFIHSHRSERRFHDVGHGARGENVGLHTTA